MESRKCVICGEGFQPKIWNRSVCYKDHYHLCPVCGKRVLSNDPNRQSCTCSRKCGQQQGNASRVKTNLQKYGVDNVSKLDSVKVDISEKLSAIHPKQPKRYKECEVCGRIFELQWPYTQHTCSPVCRGKYRQQTGIGKAVYEKAYITNISRSKACNLGDREDVSEKAAHTMEERKCLICGEKFQPKVWNSYVCYKDHHHPCPVCGKDVICNDPHRQNCTCSKACGYKVLKTYTCSVCGKQFQHSRYSTACEDCKVGTCAVCGSKFQRTSPWNQITCSAVCKGIYRKESGIAAEAAAKSKQTCIERYGVINPFQLESVKQKSKETCKNKYGVIYPTQSKLIQEKIRKTHLEKYGVNCARVLTIQDPSKVDVWLDFRSDPAKFLHAHDLVGSTLQELSQVCGVDVATISKYILDTHSQHLVRYTKSHMEDEVIDWLRHAVPDIKFDHNCRYAIFPKEIDIYFPEYRIGIECNPAMTHNSSMNPYGLKPLYYKYHADKSNLAESKDIFIFHLFGYEWIHKQEIMKSMILNLLGQTPKTIYGRHTYVCDIDNQQCVDFLDANHRQGKLFAKIRLGLRMKSTDELVAVMTFGKPRGSMGHTDSTSLEYELSRFCNKFNTHVVGGASKLFKHFVSHYDFDRIISFSDIAHTRGNLYKQLKFTAVSTTSPGYCWTTLQDDLPLHRVQCQKQYLSKMFNISQEEIDQHTERELMESHGYVRIYDSGLIKWTYNR